MLSNLAGGAAHAHGGVHADADGLLHEDLLQPGAHGNQPAGGYFNSAVIKAMREMPKPIIGRINGVAAGAGASLALACDFIVAVDTASFIEVFVNVGLVPDSGSSYFLPKAISPARAFEMATMAPKVSAEKALEWGLINRVVSADLLDEEVNKISDYYAQAPTMAIGMIKKMLNKAGHSDLQTMLQYEAYCQEIAGRSNDYREGVSAFNEKRKPVFKGN